MGKGMKTDKNSKKVKKLVCKHLDKLYSKSVAISKPFAPGMVSVSALYELIKMTKLEKDAGIPNEFVEKYNRLLELLHDTCRNNATKAGYIPSQLLKHYIAMIKKSFMEGVDADKTPS